MNIFYVKTRGFEACPCTSLTLTKNKLQVGTKIMEYDEKSRRHNEITSSKMKSLPMNVLLTINIRNSFFVCCRLLYSQVAYPKCPSAKGRTTPETSKLEHIFVAVITSPPFLLCKYFLITACYLLCVL